VTHATELHRFRRTLAAVLVVLPLLALGGAWAATRPRVENPHGRFREECSLCHGAAGWKPAQVSRKFDHAKFGFKLDGAHAAASCLGCHQSLDFSASQTQCASCHQDPHRGEMGTDCSRCHSARSFVDRGPMVRAHQLTRFPLTGSHAALDCESCHPPTAQGQLQFVSTQAECRACHMDAFRSAKTPDHVAGGFPTECQSCHSASTWNSARFDHARTGFPLTGAHRAATCESCHPGGRFQGTAKDCASCHMADYNRAQPPHASSGFAASACASCHNTGGWAGAGFDHNATAFPLTGAHRNAACQSCHGDGVYAGKPTACQSCHLSEYNSAQPPHASSGFAASACATCHNTTAWTGAVFDHNATAFPLTGAHVTATCQSCHADGVYAGKPTACQSCHITDYNAAVPNHPAAGFTAAACASCHNTTTWTGATFDHDTQYFRIYSRGHAGRWSACSDCHNSPTNFAAFNCLGCHPHDDKASTDSHHVGRSGYSYNSNACYSCHTR
jgi:hypothetical protein